MVREHCINDFKASMEYEEEVVNVIATTFVQGFNDCKAHVKRMVPKLDIGRLLSDNSNDKVGAFSLDKEYILIHLVFAFSSTKVSFLLKY